METFIPGHHVIEYLSKGRYTHTYLSDKGIVKIAHQEHVELFQSNLIIQNEVKILRKLTLGGFAFSPKVYESGKNSNGQEFFIQEYIKGDSLHKTKLECYRSDKKFSSPDIHSIYNKLLQTVKELHNEHRLAHLDLSLDNIILDTEQNIRLIDFGNSSYFSNLKNRKRAIGKGIYLAPEIKEGHYNPKADVYSIGVILEELIKVNRPKEEITRLAALGELVNRLKKNDPQSRPDINQLKKLKVPIHAQFFFTFLNPFKNVIGLLRNFTFQRILSLILILTAAITYPADSLMIEHKVISKKKKKNTKRKVVIKKINRKNIKVIKRKNNLKLTKKKKLKEKEIILLDRTIVTNVEKVQRSPAIIESKKIPVTPIKEFDVVILLGMNNGSFKSYKGSKLLNKIEICHQLKADQDNIEVGFNITEGPLGRELHSFRRSPNFYQSTFSTCVLPSLKFLSYYQSIKRILISVKEVQYVALHGTNKI